MSGIVGIYDRSGAPVDRALLQALAHFLSYRGPDARDTWSNGAIGLGHTLLRTTRESLNERQPEIWTASYGSPRTRVLIAARNWKRNSPRRAMAQRDARPPTPT